MLPAGWPAALREYLESGSSSSPTYKLLAGGQSGASVYLVNSQATDLVVKSTGRGAEPYFYSQIAPHLRASNVPVPALHAYFEQGGVHWLVLEYIPMPLPRERHFADPEVLDVLRCLHSVETSSVPVDFERHNIYRPQWSEEMNRAAAGFLSPRASSPHRMLDILEGLRRASSDLFEPVCFISGDPNPTNWGLRADHSPVLFDWERFALGTPPLDLAITMPGLPTMPDYERVAAVYNAYPRDKTLPSVTARSIAHAKVWSAVEYLAEAAGGGAPLAPATVAYLLSNVPGWLESLSNLT